MTISRIGLKFKITHGIDTYDPEGSDRIQPGMVTSSVDWTRIKNDVWLFKSGREHWRAE
jgi:hypothetical protein